VNPASNLKKWAAKKLAAHACKCEDCKTARNVLEAILRAETALLLPKRKT